MNAKVISLNDGLKLKDVVRNVKAVDIPADPTVVEYLHRAAGKHGLMLSDVSINRVERWVKSGITTVTKMIQVYRHELREQLPQVNHGAHQVPVHQFILAFGFPTITAGNVKEYATGIFQYLLTNNEVHLSQLKGKRKAEFLASVDKIADAKATIGNMSPELFEGYVVI